MIRNLDALNKYQRWLLHLFKLQIQRRIIWLYKVEMQTYTID